MSTHTARIEWNQQGSSFVDHRYSRAHRWLFDGGTQVPASSSPDVVRVPLSDPAGVDPEEALVAALSSCHMLWFLSIAATKGYVVDSYVDDAKGHMAKRPDGKVWMARTVLDPQVSFGGKQIPDDEGVRALHHEAHEQCYIASSVKTEVVVEGSWTHPSHGD